jgi:pyruvate kinase
MIDAGMTVARLNFSHGDHKMHGQTVERLREAFKLRKDKPVAIALDTKGPEIRTGILKDKKNVELKKGQMLEITTDYTFEGINECISCSYDKLP